MKELVMRTLLLDGDMLAWNVCFNPDHVESRAIGYARKLLRDLEGHRLIVCFSDPGRRYWRCDFWPAYKSKPSTQPAGLAAAKAALSAEFPSRTLDGMEADDVMGILATCARVEGEKVIVANDKDMASIPGKRFRPRDRKWFEQDLQAADYCHLLQTLTGDSSDGYPGCPGIGPERATKILDAAPCGPDWLWQAWMRVVLAFKAKGLKEADAIVQARVARICRARDFDFQTRRAIPWEPPARIGIDRL